MAAKKGARLPDDARALDQVTKAKLARKSGAEFDKDYVKAMVKDHEKDLKEFQRQAKQGKDPEVKRFASQTVPGLQHHLEMAQRLDRRLNNQGLTKIGGPIRMRIRSARSYLKNVASAGARPLTCVSDLVLGKWVDVDTAGAPEPFIQVSGRAPA